MCKTVGCDKSGNYGLPGGRREYCRDHKSDDMEYLAKKKGHKYKSDVCKEADCTMSRFYGFAEGQREYCKSHARPGMENLVGLESSCKEEECTVKYPNFGLPGESPEYCSKHKKEGMIDLRHATCATEGCSVQPTFGLERGRATHCRKHREEGMIDVNNAQCEEDGCTAQPNFGFIGEKTSRCSRHKLEGMDDLKHRQCNEDGCTLQPSFGLAGDPRASKCAIHKTKEMFNLHTYSCSACNLFTVPKRGSLCSYCDPNSKAASRTKENKVADLLKAELPDVEFVQNRTSSDIRACGDKSFRPDFQVSFPTHILMVEVDEDFHSKYEVVCELARMIALGMSGGGLPIVLTRWNPDSHRVKGKLQRIPLYERNAKLIERVRHHIDTVPDKLLTVEYLYYDDQRQKQLEDETEKVLSNYS